MASLVRQQWTLTRKILCLALLNLVLLAGLLFFFMRSQFGLGEQSLLLGPARERVLALGNSFALEYEATSASARDELIARYARRLEAEVYLVTPRATALAGPELLAPPGVIADMRKSMPPPRQGGRLPPPPRKGDDPMRPFPSEGGPPPRREGPPPIRSAESVFLSVARNPTSYWVGVRVPIAPEGDRPNEPVVLMLHTSSMFNPQLFFDWRLWAGIGLSVVAVSMLCWIPFIQSLTRSIAQMDRATARIAAGHFDTDVDTRRGDELGHLGEQINHMSSRLQSFVKNQKRFLGDIAHELCAPIARIQFALGILEQKAEGAQQPHVAALHDEIQEMSALVNELLSFSKAGLQAGVAAPLAQVDIAAVVQRAVTRECSAATAVHVDVPAGLTGIGAEALLQRALANVLRNAVRYAAAAGPISISARKDGNQVAIAVADSGPGLPDSELDAVFAPFYRPETARARETGGVGLGLAIVQTCVQACRGTVVCRNRVPSGLEVIIRLDA
jgi:two-component system, OmpR family, sensor histidine kinase CpxA